jgi:hypothetical protein
MGRHLQFLKIVDGCHRSHDVGEDKVSAIIARILRSLPKATSGERLRGVPKWWDLEAFVRDTFFPPPVRGGHPYAKRRTTQVRKKQHKRLANRAMRSRTRAMCRSLARNEETRGAWPRNCLYYDKDNWEEFLGAWW